MLAFDIRALSGLIVWGVGPGMDMFWGIHPRYYLYVFVAGPTNTLIFVHNRTREKLCHPGRRSIS